MRKKKLFQATTILGSIGEYKEYLREKVIESGIQPAQYDFAFKKIEKEPIEFQQELLGWLSHFYQNEYRAVIKLLSDFSGWKYYEMMGLTNQREQIQLRALQKELRKAWFSRPRPPKKEKPNGKQEVPKMQDVQASNQVQDSH